MGLVNDKTAAEIAEGVRVAKSVAQGALGGKMERRKQRLQSSSKTRKSRATRERIMTAAAELMTERGSTDFQMSEVSTRCHMSKGALYYYFSDKSELVEAVFSASGDELVEAIESVISESDTAKEALQNLAVALSRRMRTKSTIMLALTVEMSSMGGELFSTVSGQLSRIVGIIAGLLERGKREGSVREDVNVSVASVYLCGGLVGTAIVSAGSAWEPRDDFSHTLMELMTHGVAPVPASDEGDSTGEKDEGPQRCKSA
ncbi:MAG: TetR/AcrR family transcriptional regulator [Olsenella sp.]|jgi:AcrR family transcriptional regulator|nr:TetR/AcrR family transcriptional regulator [Olsenella sp.]MCI1288744.1 TetR/AcrR family transcriptional regulator [Olsenella sp.]